MHPTMRTGRALQLDEIANSQNKVTLGFKCSASLKIELANEATQYGMSLSEYVETISENRKAINQSVSTQQMPPNAVEAQQLKSQVLELQRKLKFFYEEPIMNKAFQKYKGQLISYRDNNEVNRKEAVNTMEDIYKILFKTVNLD